MAENLIVDIVDNISSSDSLEAESTFSDRDSALGDDTLSTTQSLTPSTLAYREENGRRYHAYYDGQYYLPNDEIEADRLDLQHHLFRLTLGGRLYLAPVPKEVVHDVLDVGCGTGIWTIEFADEHPSANVLGIDLSPIQPTEVPTNCSFLVDNVELEWTHDRKFDFIHSRAMVIGIRDWPAYIQRAFKGLKRGGYFELQEVHIRPKCDDGSAPPDSPMYEFVEHLYEAGTKAGLDLDAAMKIPDLLRQAGFVDIHVKRFKWPIGPWAKGKREKLLGKWCLQDILDGAQGMALAFFTRILGFSRERVEVLLSEFRKELQAQKSHFYFTVVFIYGRKPAAGTWGSGLESSSSVMDETSPEIEPTRGEDVPEGQKLDKKRSPERKSHTLPTKATEVSEVDIKKDDDSSATANTANVEPQLQLAGDSSTHEGSRAYGHIPQTEEESRFHEGTETVMEFRSYDEPQPPGEKPLS
ncbi:S-adenosyl-L-methionine-dependent methyltransferase [Patellaria atrata CBS 101060]|uniref:S-adenosyl-L-methionine-dependent methyltransferase n=1 Tax=Patellaria atrata CBS 101060 TaxID=1346257 RepID=A0A9P4VNR8_9PEZI|nr:S-adenosyl-L-methionine-dependent methyltransferase [Patellaria atrata CBS 101060]